VPLEQLPEVKKGYGVFAEKRFLEGEESTADYFVDHSAFVYVIDKDDQLREIFPYEAPVDDIVADVQHLLSQ
jgi:protein SCO1/2